MRKHYLDNLRTIMILLLFPVHTFMIWNNYGKNNVFLNCKWHFKKLLEKEHDCEISKR